ncbi:2-oxo-4-hydroxy-4-carboxy-5-ureidoimidazoline decarboxylase [Rhodococcoides trifolii]|nr:2-oxo-4-hydroxy-4-carboxy-5-ureidoimidazoline decarboxylase [Rhodococcus trifolii]
MESLFRNAESGELRVDDMLRSEARDLLRTCLDIPRWVDALLDGRPYFTGPALRDAVMTAAAPFTSDEIDNALGHHPRIGDRPTGDDAHAANARAEQSGVDATHVQIRARLDTGNRSYEARFGRVFLIRAAGRDADDILRELERRLQNDAATELGVVEHELREIAAVRLTGGALR